MGETVPAAADDARCTAPVRRFLVAGAWALPVYGVLLTLGTVTHQPDYTADFPAYADYVTTTQFLVGHLGASIFGSALGFLGIGCVALLVALRGPHAARALTGAALVVVGNVVNTALFGVAAFAQPAVGRAFQRGLAEAEQINADIYGPELAATAVVGLLAFIVGAILVGGAIRRGDPALRGAGLVVAVTLPLFVVTGLLGSFVQPVAAGVFTVAAVRVARTLTADRPSAGLG